MRILLMMAPTGEKQHSVHSGRNYPIALAQLAGQISGHDLRGYDPDMDPDYPRSLPKVIAGHAPDLVGISFRIFDTTLSYEPRSYLPGLEWAVEQIRRSAPNAIIALGGSAFSFFPEAIMRKLRAVDAGFFLEGDLSFPAFVRDTSSPQDVQGLYFRRNGEVVFTGRAPGHGFDGLAMPDFNLFPLSPYADEGSVCVGIESKRGCRLECTPCVYPYLTGKTIHSKKPERVLLEAQELTRRGVPSFFFLDSIFNIPRAHAVEVSETLRTAGLPIRWGAFFSASGFDDALCRLTYEAGCRYYFFAPDGISGQAIRTYRRPITLRTQKRAIDLVRKNPDTHLHVSFLIGSPGEGLRDLFEFTKMLSFLAVRKIFSISMSYTRIYPQTKLWESLVQEGALDPNENLLEPKFYRPFPSSLARFIFHPAYRAVHAFLRIRKKLRLRSRRLAGRRVAQAATREKTGI